MREAELRALPEWQHVAALAATIAAARRLQASGDVARAHELAASWQLQYRQQRIIDGILEAIPLLVLGPFGEPAGTQGAGRDLGNPEVVPEFKGMETAYLDESTDPTWRSLRASFQPDLTHTYAVYPEKQAGWQQVVKTENLPFYGKCHSPHPLWMVAYAYAEVYCPESRDATILAGSPHAIWIWVNDRQVLRHGGSGTPRGGQRPAAPRQNRGNFTLQQGWNRVLLKAVQRGESLIYLRLCDRNGNGMDDLRFRLPGRSSP
jgi:hypothetical protein